MEPSPTLSDSARHTFLRTEGRAPILTDWQDAIFLHFAVNPAVLQPLVPFELDLWQGDGYVSVVAFTQQRFRLSAGGPATSWMTWPIANYRFCNLRTYVRSRGESGVFFLVEWIANWPSVLLARATYGLPYRLIRSRYSHDPTAGTFDAEVILGESRLAFRAHTNESITPEPAPPASLDAFCLERYIAFTASRWSPLYFRIWHPPWTQQRVPVTVVDDSLLRSTGEWYTNARLAAANHCPGIEGVWIARPHRLA